MTTARAARRRRRRSPRPRPSPRRLPSWGSSSPAAPRAAPRTGPWRRLRAPPPQYRRRPKALLRCGIALTCNVYSGLQRCVGTCEGGVHAVDPTSESTLVRCFLKQPCMLAAQNMRHWQARCYLASSGMSRFILPAKLLRRRRCSAGHPRRRTRTPRSPAARCPCARRPRCSRRPAAPSGKCSPTTPAPRSRERAYPTLQSGRCLQLPLLIPAHHAKYRVGASTSDLWHHSRGPPASHDHTFAALQPHFADEQPLLGGGEQERPPLSLIPQHPAAASVLLRCEKH